MSRVYRLFPIKVLYLIARLITVNFSPLFKPLPSIVNLTRFWQTGVMTIQTPSYQRYRFLSEIISHAVWLHHRFCLSFREVEELLAERGVTVTYETVRQGFPSATQAQRFLTLHGFTQNLFRLGRHLHAGGPLSHGAHPAFQFLKEAVCA
jgi:hypothetical protein